MQKFLVITVLTLTTLTMGGCSSLEFPGVYKLTIEQGNIVTQEMVDQLKPGMSREQVEFIMGSPMIKDSFNSNRWDYLYSIEKGDEPRKQHRLTIFFEYDRLKYFTGDFVPSAVTGEAPSSDNATMDAG